MKMIIVIIPKFNHYTILTQSYFIDGSEFKTQNEIVEVLKLIGLVNERDFTCDIIYKNEI